MKPQIQELKDVVAKSMQVKKVVTHGVQLKMEAQEWIRVLTHSSTFYTMIVHTPKPPHRAFLSYQNIGLHSWG
jgi:hypothetical protein